MRMAILDDYFNAALSLADWDRLKGRAEVKVFTEPLQGEEEAARQLADFEIIVGMRERTPFPATLIRRLPKLKLLITTGMRNLSFDLEAASKQGITVCGTGGVGNPTSELAIGLIIALMRDIPGQFESMRRGGWQTRPGYDLAGKTLGVLGLGRVGGAVAAVGNALNMKVIAWSQNLTEDRAVECRARRVKKEELLKEADVVSIHLVLSARTRGIVGEKELSLMKPTAYLVNTSRGPIVDEDALLKALQEKKIAGAALDVYGTEPLPARHPFRSLENVLLTPHLGYVSVENFAKMYHDAVEDIIAFLDGKPVRVLNTPE
ncbi:MAG TPA: D-2-hydroxyacid dehydrogenase family protein [Thermodesulfobacteriota bacterium]|nr:D-2-hydroxyacid dehydrogenase family protein [Thermodesulfobacteriota bacterium]